MPKNLIDYSKTFIYKICCKDPTVTDIYVGHTTNLIKRRSNHKKSCSNENDKGYNYYVYQFIRDNGGWDNWQIVLIEECNLTNHNEATQKERYWLEELHATLNKVIPSRDIKEYYEEYYDNNKEKILEQRKERYENNKEKLKEKFKCECGGCYDLNNKARHFKSKKHQDFKQHSE